MKSHWVIAACLAASLCVPATAFADEKVDVAIQGSESLEWTLEDDQALWAAVEEKAKRECGSEENLGLQGEEVQPNGRSTSARPAKYPIAKGFILVTDDKYKGVVPSGHAGIVYSVDTAIESMPEGVVKKANTWWSRYNTCYGGYVKDTTQAVKNQAADWAAKQLGKPYNYDFYNINTTQKFYCSQLVWASYKKTVGIDLNASVCGQAIHPAELSSSSKVQICYRQTKKP
jgi:Uncharacterized distant relative of cell wall-associated hydrolases